jgi:hypothetical protein
MEAGPVQGTDQLRRFVIAGDLEAFGLGLGGIAGDARDLFDSLLDRLAAGAAAVVDSADGQAADLTLGRPAVAREMDGLTVRPAMKPGGG